MVFSVSSSSNIRPCDVTTGVSGQEECEWVRVSVSSISSERRDQAITPGADNCDNMKLKPEEVREPSSADHGKAVLYDIGKMSY